MKKARIAVLVMAGISLLTLLVVAWVVESRYEAVFRSPRITHETFSSASTALKVVVRPPLAQRRIAQLLLPNRSLPDWVLDMTVPEETSLLFDTDLDDAQLRVRLFINYARLGPVVRDALNQSGFTAVTPGITWAPPEVVEKERGVLLLDGAAAMRPDLVQGVREQWGMPRGYVPPVVEGKHVFEAALENRHGGGFAAIAALVQAGGPPDPSVDKILAPANFYAFGTLRAYADFASDDVIKLTVLAEANPAAGPKADQQVKTFLDLAMGLVKGELRKNYGVVMEGKSVAEGMTVRGEYTLTGIQAFLATLTPAS